MSVDTNPSGLTHRHKYGESQYDGLFAEPTTAFVDRVVYGVDNDTHRTADASRLRDIGTGQFVEASKPTTRRSHARLLEAGGTPPIVLFSGSLD
ncbi:MAG: hypothetical protein U0165_06225 [Polyangiaceae bacterium]